MPLLYFAHLLGMGAGGEEEYSGSISAAPGAVGDLGVGLFSGFLGG